MSPILGIIASSNFQAVTSSYASIATTTLSTATASITFSSIPATYTHLQIRAMARTDRALTRDAMKVTYNGNTTTYAYHNLFGDGATVTAQGLASQPEMAFNDISGASATASVFGVMVIDILDYANTNKVKTFRALGGYDNNGSGAVGLNSGMFSGNNNAITTITLSPYGGSNFVTYSSFALYGIKGA